MSGQDANNVTLTGYVVADPELKEVGEGKLSLATFDVAVQGSFESVSYFEVKYWGPLANRVKKAVKKGSRVIVTGRLNQEKWKNKDGENRSTIAIVGSSFEFLRGPSKKKTEDGEQGETVVEEGKDIPFE